MKIHSAALSRIAFSGILLFAVGSCEKTYDCRCKEYLDGTMVGESNEAVSGDDQSEAAAKCEEKEYTVTTTQNGNSQTATQQCALQ